MGYTKKVTLVSWALSGFKCPQVLNPGSTLDTVCKLLIVLQS